MSIVIGCGPGASPIQIDAIEDAAARVVDMESGKAVDVPRRALPEGAREGDILVNGRRDDRLTEEYRARLRQLQFRITRPLSGHLDL